MDEEAKSHHRRRRFLFPCSSCLSVRLRRCSLALFMPPFGNGEDVQRRDARSQREKSGDTDTLKDFFFGFLFIFLIAHLYFFFFSFLFFFLLQLLSSTTTKARRGAAAVKTVALLKVRPYTVSSSDTLESIAAKRGREVFFLILKKREKREVGEGRKKKKK